MLAEIAVYRAKIPLTKPYKVSRWEFHHFEPFIASVRDEAGNVGWGEAVVTDGYGHETYAEGWRVLNQQAEAIAGQSTARARALLARTLANAPQATSVLLMAVEMLEDDPLLQVETPTRVPLLEPVAAFNVDEVPAEVERLIGLGFRTFKVKVGFDPDADLRRVAAIQKAMGERAEIRLDANQAYSVEDGKRFASRLEPHGIQLFEQPCNMDDWDANAAVAAVSTVPVMLDESIYGLADIDRAGAIPGVGYVKLKLKKLGGVQLLKRGLQRIRDVGLRPVLGDGTATEIGCWFEACVARSTIDNAGENNGFLKLATTLFRTPLTFDSGDLVLEPGVVPDIDAEALAHCSEQRNVYRTAG
jgi:L-alanine-DL-glutamate epimerase-like enolase superfamily enzyme